MPPKNAVKTEFAAQCFFNGFLKESPLWEHDSQKRLITIPLNSTQGELHLAYHHLSQCGPHQFTFPLRYRSNTPTLPEGPATDIDCLTAIEMIIDEPALVGEYSNEQKNTFLERVKQSIDNTHFGINQRLTELPHLFQGPLNFIEAEQALLIGHSMHPAPKSRSDFASEDFKYVPESGLSFGLHWFAVNDTALAGEFHLSTTEQAVAAILSDLDLDLHNMLPASHRLLPVHPWQAKVLLQREDIQQLITSQDILDLGPYGDGWRATSSLRAIYHPDCRYMLKFSLSVKLTNSVRHLSVKEVERAMRLEQVLDTDAAATFKQRYPSTAIMREPGYLGIRHLDSGIIEPSLLAFRDNPFYQKAQQESYVLATLTQANPVAHNTLAANLVSKFANERQYSFERATQIWFQAYLEHVLEPLIIARSDYGLIFLAHQQNIVIDMNNGIPAGMFYRDCQGTGFTCHAQQCFKEVLGQQSPENFMHHQHVDPYLSYYLIVNSTFCLISALADNGQSSEQQLLTQMRLFLQRLQQRQLADKGFLEYLLTSEKLIFKNNFSVYLSNINENSIGDPSQIYSEMPNPLQQLTAENTLVKLLTDGSIIGFETVEANLNAVSIVLPDRRLHCHWVELSHTREIQLVPTELETQSALNAHASETVTAKRLNRLQTLALIDYCLSVKRSQSKVIKAVTLSLATWSAICFEPAPHWCEVNENQLFITADQIEQCEELWLTAISSKPEKYVSTGKVSHPLRPSSAQGVLFRRFDFNLKQELTLRLADSDNDLAVFHQWQNQPRVAEFWELNKDKVELQKYLTDVNNTPHSMPVIAAFDGIDFGYFEYYWAKEDRLGPYYDVEDYDRGFHLLIGNDQYLGKKYWQVWGRCISQYGFLSHQNTQRLVGEPRVDNSKLIRIWEHFGFSKIKEFDFPHKRSSLVMLNRQRFFSVATPAGEK